MNERERIVDRFKRANADQELRGLVQELQALRELDSNLMSIEQAFDAHFASVTAGIDPTIKSQIESIVKAKQGFEQAEKVILVADQTKFDRTAFERICPLASLDHLVTDSEPPANLANSLAKAKVNVHVAPQ